MAQTITRVIPDGDYPNRINQLYAAVMEAVKDEQKNPEMLLAGEEPTSLRLAGEYEALKAEAEADAREKRRVVTMRALGRSTWRELRTKHPVRLEPDVDAEIARGDRLAGLNTDSVEDDLVFAAIAEPRFTSRSDYDEWADQELTEGEFQLLLRDAWSLVNTAQVDPKSLPPSQIRSNGGN